MKTIKYATINRREYRVVTTAYGASISHTSVQVLVVFKDDNGSQWRALPWFAEKRIAEILKMAK